MGDAIATWTESVADADSLAFAGRVESELLAAGLSLDDRGWGIYGARRSGDDFRTWFLERR